MSTVEWMRGRLRYTKSLRAVLILKISTSVFINPHFFPFPCFDLYELYWLCALSKGIVYLKLGMNFDGLGLKDSKILWYLKPGSRIGYVLFTFCLFQEVCPTTFTFLPNIPELSAPPSTHPSLKGIWISLVPDCSHKQ